MNALIDRHTEAEEDSYLLETFHDTGALQKIIDESDNIVAGRKGSGKTALAVYLESNPERYGLDAANRISVRGFNTLEEQDERSTLKSLLSYVAISTVKYLLTTDCLKDEGKSYWLDFLENNGLQQVSDYETYVASRRTTKKSFSLKAVASAFWFKGEGGAKRDSEIVRERASIDDSPSALFDAITQTVREDCSIAIMIDDLSDYLDESDGATLKSNINVIKNFLLAIKNYNVVSARNGGHIRFISLVRYDLFSFMEGSNTNKLVSSSYEVEWSEKDFASLLIRRLPYFESKRDTALKDPVRSIKQIFPDHIFAEALKGFDTNRYASNFYAYMCAISFNRPRDFLQYLYALRNRLSASKPATMAMLTSAEIEYTDYFHNELRDELYVASRLFHYDLTEDRIVQLIELLSRRTHFKAPELRTDLSRFLGEKTSLGRKKIEILLTELWRYGIVGVSDDNDEIIRFKYLNDKATFTSQSIARYTFYLHRGLWWFAQKYKKSSVIR